MGIRRRILLVIALPAFLACADVHEVHEVGRDAMGTDGGSERDGGCPSCECTPGERRSCATALPGVCLEGSERCGEDGRWARRCDPPPPTAERCNGLDDDCDGIADEAGCAEEICDGRDNDMDGTIDEGCPVCEPVGPETCDDGVDEDCDGFIDEFCETCTPLPGGDGCNERDDDCDGVVDEDCDTSCRTTDCVETRSPCRVPDAGGAFGRRTHCSGRVLAAGSMCHCDGGAHAAAACAEVEGATCCEYHLYGEGFWRATDGVVQDGEGDEFPPRSDDTIQRAGPCR